ncbi:hypothetical protein [Methylococcus sp. EFPC2]|uniref:hypothetical protein n=1 Tax=Methylococcus sp. EFPC2 TaxID=2812648 RepID=UPI001966DF86|nr:hypothetical protein [Methylococcus sp. EFPC2]QSA97616.1 hypothetical protein JWZ97_01875 [Methylococcus sp. EFPC2]
MNKMKTGLMTAAALAAVAMAPQAATAADKKASPAPTVQSALEKRLIQLEQELTALRSEVAKSRAETKADVKAATAKVEAHQAQVDQKFAEAEEHEKSHHDLLFFRGGYAALEHARTNELLVDNATAGVTTHDKDGDGWYVGAGFDHRLTDDLWGLTDFASVDGEVMFEYKNYGTSTNTLVAAAAIGDGAGGTVGNVLGTIENKITQFTLTAAPKIKFNQFGDFRPWIIPFGLGIHVISPPSSGVTVLNPGLMVGTGAEYRIWRDLYAGLDFRYHFTGDDLDIKNKNSGVTLKGVDTDGFTTGAYLGFGF